MDQPKEMHPVTFYDKGTPPADKGSKDFRPRPRKVDPRVEAKPDAEDGVAGTAERGQ